MGLLSKAADTIYAFRFLKLLTTPFNKTKAFELGIIDAKGKILKKSRELKTAEEKAAYTHFHRLVFNIKKIIPGNTFGSYAAALFLLKEHTGMSERKIMEVLKETTYIREHAAYTELDSGINKWYLSETRLIPGTFKLVRDIAHPVTGEIIGFKGNIVENVNFKEPVGSFQDINIYEVKHKNTNQILMVTNYDITR